MELATAPIDFVDADVIVDGLFGSGLSRDLSGVAAELVGAINAAGKPVLALDLPSGLDADTGMRRGVAVNATVSVAFIVWKRGMFTGDAADLCGERELATLDVNVDALGIAADAALLDASIGDVVAPRRENSNKGTFGHVCAVGGGHGMGGAIRLCAEAALRAGAGLVTAATRAEHVFALNAARPEILAHGVSDASDLAPLIERASVLAIGPGLGRDAWARALFESARASGKPAVFDADALTLLAEVARELPEVAVITPHPGEAARLLDCDIATVQSDRFAAVRELSLRYCAVAVLKGAGSLIADRDGRVAVCPWGNPGMSSGGMGDLLTGVIAALLAQGLTAWTAACLGVAVHARAGDRAAGPFPRGLIATDLLMPVRELLNPERQMTMSPRAAVTLEFPALDERSLIALAASLAPVVRSGGTLHLRGELGAGKTTFARALLLALGVGGRVKSPTYSLIESYRVGALGIHHLDLYRLADAAELEWLGLDDLVDGASLFLIEWPERGVGRLPEPDLLLELAHRGSVRSLVAIAASASGTQWLQALPASR